jgi:hypothetical protein
MSTGNNYNVIVDGSLLVYKSCLVNGQLTSNVLKSYGDVISSSYSLNTLGDIIKPSPIDSNTNYGNTTLNIYYNSGSYNSCVGYNSMFSNLSGNYNNALGYKTLYSNTSGSNNNSIGYNSLYSNISGNLNIAIGSNSLYGNISGNSNIGIGYNTLYNNKRGSTNIAIGDYSFGNTTTNIVNNIGIGYNSLYNNQANDNIGIGVSTLYKNTTGNQNIAIGNGANFSNTIGSYNIGIGYGSLNSNMSGTRNIGLGIGTLQNNMTDDNIAIGNNTLYNNLYGTKNIGIGINTLNSNTSGNNNIGIGFEALKQNTSGTNNIAIGYQANNTNTINISTIAIGTNSTPTANNQIIIGNGGYNTYVNASSLFIGNNNYSVGSYYVTINGSTNISGDTTLSGNSILVGKISSNVSFVSNGLNISSDNFSINSNSVTLNTPKLGIGKTNPTGKLHIYESIGTGDLSLFIWNTIGGNPNGSINAIVTDSNNNVYVAGSFSTISGVSANNIAKWNGTIWSALGSGLTDSNGISSNAIVYSLGVDSNNNIYVGGRFDRAHITTVNNIAKWSGTEWSAMGTGTVGVTGVGSSPSQATVYSIAVTKTNTVYFGGVISYINITNANNIVYWDGTNLNPVGTGIVGNGVYAIAIDSSNNIFIGGSFNTAGGVSVSNIAYYTGSVWTAMGTGVTGGTIPVRAIGIDSTNNVYVGGDFTTAGGSTSNYIAKWSSTWSTISYSGNNGTNGSVYSINIDNINNVYIGGNFTTAGGMSVNNIAKWNNSYWTRYYYNGNIGITGGTIPIKNLYYNLNNNNIYIGGDFTNVGGNTTINYLTYYNTVYSYYNNVSYNTSYASQNLGTLILEHGNSGGCSSIVFPSTTNNKSDYGYIQYRDNINDGNISHNGRLEIGVENDALTDTLVLQKNGGYVGIGTTSPTGVLHIFETTGVSENAGTGTLVLEHGNSGGKSSIIFPSTNNRGSDYGYIIYRDDVSNSNKSERSRLEIGTENDSTNINNYDALILQKNGGYVGIGTSSPESTLHVIGTTILQSTEIELSSRENNWNASYWNNNYGLRLGWNKTGGQGMVGYCCHGQTVSGGHEFWSMNVTQTTPVSAKVQASVFNAISDYRIKENIIKIKNTNYDNLFYELNPVYYFNKHKNANDFGFIAHEVQELYPELVDGEKDVEGRFQSLNYSGLVPICVNEIQKQNEIIKQLKTEIQEIRDILNTRT